MPAQHLHGFSNRLAEIVQALPDAERDAAVAELKAECTQCGLFVTGGELLSLAKLDPASPPAGKTGRLLLGYCGRQGCDGRFYNISMPPVVQHRAEAAFQPGEVASGPAAETPAMGADPRRRVLIRVSIVVLLLVAAWMARQYYVGGRIPLLRDPETFVVQPPPQPSPSGPRADDFDPGAGSRFQQ